MSEPTPEWIDLHLRWGSARSSALTAEFKAGLDAITDPVARLILDHHADVHGTCYGCDEVAYDEYAGTVPWPCSTTWLIAQHFGIEGAK